MSVYWSQNEEGWNPQTSSTRHSWSHSEVPPGEKQFQQETQPGKTTP